MQIEQELGLHRQGDSIVLMSLSELYRSYLEPYFGTDKELYAVLMSKEVAVPIRTAPAPFGLDSAQRVRTGPRHWASLQTPVYLPVHVERNPLGKALSPYSVAP